MTGNAPVPTSVARSGKPRRPPPFTFDKPVACPDCLPARRGGRLRRLKRPLRRLWVPARSWLAVRHSRPAELALVVALYLAYEGGRGLVAAKPSQAVGHAHLVVALERSLHIFFEGGVQHAAATVPGLTSLLGLAYLGMHLPVTAAVLLWLHQRRPAVFAFVRTALLLASAFALVGFLLFPTAPPRLAEIGIADTVSRQQVSLNGSLTSALYNPYAAVPSMHIGYALVVGASLVKFAGRRALRLAGALYPLFMLLVVTATGNHFFVDALAGVLAAVLAGLVALPIARPAAGSGLRRLDTVRLESEALEERAA